MQNLFENKKKDMYCHLYKKYDSINLPANALIERSQKWLRPVSVHGGQKSTGINVYFSMLLIF